jgi:uncharacterized protein (DUF1501 family)
MTEERSAMDMNRRQVLKATGALAAMAAPFGRVAFGARPAGTQGKTLVVLFLRGGVDGLNLVVPHGEGRYYELRQYIAIPRPGRDGGALELDERFGLHPSAEPLRRWFESGEALAVHAVGRPGNSRSHFEEQDRWETAVDAPDLRTAGWLNRHLMTSEGRGPVRAVAIGDSLPRMLRGDAPALALRGLDDLAFAQGAGGFGSLAPLLEHERAAGDEADAQELLRRSVAEAVRALRELSGVADASADSGVEYPQTGLARKLREVARLVRGDVGLEVAAVDLGGWDTHQDQGGARGTYANRVGELAGALSAFLEDLGERREDVLVLTLTEFGRTAAQNGTGGTDHGTASCSLLVGGGLARRADARPVLGQWPGLEPEELRDRRDLAPATDYRDLIAEAVADHLGNPALDVVLPGHARGELRCLS